MTKVTLKLSNIVNDTENAAKELKLNVLEALIKKANDKYYNSDNPLFTDKVYDTLIEVLQKRSPQNSLINSIGAPIIGEKFKLPIHMGSMDKIKTIEGLQKWFMSKTGEYIISDKLDGTSCGYQLKDNKVTLFSRGSGKEGRNISHMLPYLNIPNVTNMKELTVRGELVISKQNFIKFNKSDSRSVVNGLSLRKNVTREDLQYVEFIAYEIITPNNLTCYDQFQMLDNLGFKVVQHQKISHSDITNYGSNIENSFVYKKLFEFKTSSEYQIDGLIVTENKIYDRNTSGNPKYSFAFKSNEEGKEVKVLDVEWNVSKHGVLKPRVIIEQVILNGANVNKATAHHAKYVFDNKIGPGSILSIVRSGDVIPYIDKVIKSSESAKMPSQKYIWNESKVNILLAEDNSDDHKLKKMLSFIKTLGIENMSIGIIKKLVENGYNTIYKILNITKDELLKLPGFKQTLSDKLYNNIHKVIDNPIDLSVLMTSSLKFGSGFGIKRFNLIIDKYPNIMDIEISEDMIIQIPSFQSKIANQFIKGLPEFKKFLNELPMLKPKIKDDKVQIIGSLFKEQGIVMTGFTSKDIEDFISKNGGTIQKSVNKKTNLLISKNLDSTSSKFKSAIELNIKIITKEEFIKRYNI